jgi:hypothetical protein
MLNKEKTNTLFKDPNLAAYKPRFGTYETKYTPSLADQIISDIASPVLVIKPTNSSLGSGVIIVPQEQLDQTLKLILQDKQDIITLYKRDPTYFHWTQDSSTHFIVEEFFPSKTIMVDGKPYDPTLRVMFALFNDAGHIGIHFFASYWKLPPKSLTEEGKLIEKRKSNISSQRISSARVDQDDFKKVQTLMIPMLALVYEKMLSIRYQQ